MSSRPCTLGTSPPWFDPCICCSSRSARRLPWFAHSAGCCSGRWRLPRESSDPDLAYSEMPMIPAGFTHAGRMVALLLAITCTACTLTPPREAPPEAWENRLQDDSVVMLGEVHDNAMQHRLRLEILRRAFAAGWRPAIVMEQFDHEHQAEIDRARRERPMDAQHVIDL